MTRQTRSPLHRAKDDLGVAQRRLDRANARAKKAETEAKSAANDVKDAARQVEAYRALVESLGGPSRLAEDEEPRASSPQPVPLGEVTGAPR